MSSTNVRLIRWWGWCPLFSLCSVRAATVFRPTPVIFLEKIARGANRDFQKLRMVCICTWMCVYSHCMCMYTMYVLILLTELMCDKHLCVYNKLRLKTKIVLLLLMCFDLHPCNLTLSCLFPGHQLNGTV